MINNEIRRLLACLVAASNENGTTLEEIQEALKKLFNKEEKPELLNMEEPTFREKAIRFVKNERFCGYSLSVERAVDMLCLYHEMQKDLDGDVIDEQLFRQELAKKFNIKVSSLVASCRKMKYFIYTYLEKNGEYSPSLRSKSGITVFLSEIMHCIESY